ncbi:MAG: ATP-binding protein [Cyanobacteria bacterium J06627_28]
MGVTFLGGLARLVEHRGGSIIFNWQSLQKRISVNLAQNGFLQAFGCAQVSWDGNSIPYRSDLEYHAESIGDYLHTKWLGKGWVNISPELQDLISGKVAEIYLNAFDHSQSPIGIFSCGQHYPRLGWLHLTAVDFGMGIPQSVRSLPANKDLSSTDALEWALRSGTSTKPKDIGSGLGLNLLQSFVIANGGSLKIFSNDSCLIIDDNGVKYKNVTTNFTGTLIDIAFRCDESYYCLEAEASSPDEPWF